MSSTVRATVVSSTPSDLINFLKLSRIILEDVPDALRSLFYDEIYRIYAKNWSDDANWGKWFLQQDRFTSKLTVYQKKMIEDGLTENWDSTLLFHALLYSSHFLLTDSIPDGPRQQLSVTHNSKKATTPSLKVNLTHNIRSGHSDHIILDFGGSDFIKAEVANVRPTEIIFKRPISLPPSSPSLNVYAYLRLKMWYVVEELSFIRNNEFAHRTSARITNQQLIKVVQKIENNYKYLNFTASRISSLKKILSEPIVESSIAQKVEHYREMWLKECKHYEHIMKCFENIQTDVAIVKEKEIPEIKKGLSEAQESYDKLKIDQQKMEKQLACTVFTLEETYREVKEQSDEQISAMKSHQKAMEDKQESHERQLTSLDEKLTQTSSVMSVFHRKQTNTSARVSHTIQLIKEVSDDKDKEIERLDSKTDALADTEKQISECIYEMGGALRQLSEKDDELSENIEELAINFENVKVDVTELKKVLQQKGISSKLSVSYFESDISYLNGQYHEGTRQWLFDHVLSLLKQSVLNTTGPKILLVTGNPGMGKSVIAAKLISIFKHDSKIAGWFFFQHHMGRRSNCKMLVQSLCHQMMSTVSGFSAQVEEHCSDIDPSSLSPLELFACLIREPLHHLPPDHAEMIIVIDALDECDFESQQDLTKLFIREFVKLPKWLSIIATTRPDQKLLRALKRVKHVIELLQDDPRNLNDIRIFLVDFFKEKISNSQLESAVELLLKKSEGMFLYFYYAIDSLAGRAEISLDELEKLLPDGIDDYYELNFHRLFEAMGKEKYHKLLQAILASRSPGLPHAFVGRLLDLDVQETTKVVTLISTLFPVHNDCIAVFHKSVLDWLLNDDLAGQYAIDLMAGQKSLAKICHSLLQQINTAASLSDTVHQYVILNVMHHLCQVSAMHQFSSYLMSTIESLVFLYLRLLFSHGNTEGLLEDLAEVRKAFSKNIKLRQKAQDISSFIQRCAHVLIGKPYLILQCTLNEPDVFSRRLRIEEYLSNPSDTFKELKVILQVINKNQEFSSSLISFTSDDNISSCLFSPNQDNIICSDYSSMISIWEVNTGELVCKVDLSSEFNMLLPINECSVSPNGELVTYGNLSTAINMKGEMVPLIATKKDHNVNTCIFSPGGQQVLAYTFHPDGFFELMEEVGYSLDYTFNLQLWDINKSSHHIIHSLRKKEMRPLCVCFSSDGTHIYCGYRNGRVAQFDVSSLEATAIIFTNGLTIKKESEKLEIDQFEGVDDPVMTVNCSNDGHFLIACTKNNGLLVWDAAALEFLCAHKTESNKSYFISGTFSSDCKYLAAGTSKGTLKIWSIREFEFSLEISVNPDGSFNPLVKCIFDQHTNVLCVIGNTARLYSYDALVQMMAAKSTYDAVHLNQANVSIFVPDGKHAITCGGHNLCLWNVALCQLVSLSNELDGYLVRMSSDGKVLLSYGDRCFIEVWDIANLKKTNVLSPNYEESIINLPYDPDGSSETDICHCAVSVNAEHCIVVGGTGEGRLFVWHGRNFELQQELHAHESLITFIDFSPNGDSFVSADSDGMIMMWQLESNDAQLTFNNFPLYAHQDSIEQVCYSPQGKRIASCSMDKNVHLHNGSNGDLIAKLEGHKTGVMRVIFSSDGCNVASGDEHGSIFVWDGFTGKQKQCLQSKSKKIVLDLFFVAADKYICIRDTHSQCITVYDVTTGSEVSCLFFDADIFALSAATFWKNSSYLLCTLKNEKVKFIKLLEV